MHLKAFLALVVPPPREQLVLDEVEEEAALLDQGELDSDHECSIQE